MQAKSETRTVQNTFLTAKIVVQDGGEAREWNVGDGGRVFSVDHVIQEHSMCTGCWAERARAKL